MTELQSDNEKKDTALQYLGLTKGGSTDPDTETC